MSDQLQLGSVFAVSLCCIWPIIAHLILSRASRLARGLSAMLDRLIHRSRYQ